MAQSPGTAKIVADAQLYDELKEHPAWRRLHEHAEAEQERFGVGLAKRLMAGEEVSLREVDFHRGFFRGVIWVLKHPEMAMGNLESAARKALVLMELELEQERGDDSPYL